MSKHIQFAIQFNCQSIVSRNSIRKYLWYKQKCSLFTFIEVKRNMLLKQITFVANIVILSPVMAPKNLCAFTCVNQKTPLIAHEWRMPRYHEGLTKALKKISISDRYVILLSFPFEVILKLYCLPNISSGRSRIQRYLQSDLKVSPKGFRFLCWFPFSLLVSVFSVGFRFQTNDLISLSNHTSLGTWQRKN